jgi:glyoxylate reductase
VTRPPIVLVASELRELAGETPEWPGGAATRFARPDDEASAGDAERVVAIVPLVSQPVGEPELDRYPALRVVANYGVGTDNLDVAAIRARGVEVTNTPDVLTDATADLAMSLILAAARRLREGWHPTQLLGMGLQEKRLGILGAGRIGFATARRARAFGMEILYWDRSGSVELERQLAARRVTRLDELLESADVVSVHVPLSEETANLLDARRLALIGPEGILVNTARGAIVDQDALARALRSGRLGAAGLDVFAEEPAIPTALRDLPNCFVLPHLGSATRETRKAMWELAASNVRCVLSDMDPPTPVR